MDPELKGILEAIEKLGDKGSWLFIMYLSKGLLQWIIGWGAGITLVLLSFKFTRQMMGFWHVANEVAKLDHQKINGLSRTAQQQLIRDVGRWFKAYEQKD